MDLTAAASKGEPPCRIEREEAERMQAARMVPETDMAESAYVKELMRNSLKYYEEGTLKSAVARRKLENRGAPPIVLESLTKQERAALIREEEAKIRRFLKESSAHRNAELAAALERRRGVPEEKSKTNRSGDGAERNYARCRNEWNCAWGDEYGSFEDITSIPPMCFTDNPVPGYTWHTSTLQIFSFKVAKLGGGLQWPLDVFGNVSVRDTLDHNRNVIFARTRDNCQTLTEQDPYLVLTGPTRAPLYGLVHFDAVLKVKGTTESEDKDLCLLASRYACCESFCDSCVSSRTYTSKLNKLEVTCGIVDSAVEATISMRVVDVSWPDEFRGRFTACLASLRHMKVLLLDSRDEKVSVAAADGTVKLSRHVVSVEKYGKLVISVAAVQGGGDQEVAVCELVPKEAGRSHGTLEFGFCKMEVEVAWSLFPKYYPSEFLPASKGSGEAGGSRSSAKLG